MKIIALTAENIKRLVAVEIRPDGNLVQITGKNGSGKTSTLDSIWWALAGAKHIQAAPIRKGANHARIRLDMGEIIVTRTFKKEKEGGGGFTTKLEVVGNVKGSPQAMLDSLLDSLAFDPLAFARMDPADQFEALKKYVPDVNFDKIAAENSIDFAARTDRNRRAKEERILADKIVLPDKCPEARVDESALIKELADAGQRNGDIQSEAERRRRTSDEIRLKKDRARELRDRAAELIRGAEAMEQSAEKLSEGLAAAAPLPEPISLDELKQKIDQARTRNRQVSLLEEKTGHEELAARFEKEAKALTARMERREEEKRAAIAAAKLPVEGITFGDGVVLLNGVPFDQASDAEQLKASCALAMAGSPQLRVLRVRDGSLLDGDSLELLATMAADRDYQIWIERCSNGERVGFVLEDGTLKYEPAQPAEQGSLI